MIFSCPTISAFGRSDRWLVSWWISRSDIWTDGWLVGRSVDGWMSRLVGLMDGQTDGRTEGRTVDRSVSWLV